MEEWGLGAMNAEYAYAAGYTGKNAVIGVLDSGYYDKHPELAPSRFSPHPCGRHTGRAECQE